uniref:Uncharacterized protein n=1 Tax=Rhizophora mucronata TaxID=61149 RepID=A0A2P2QJ13_RHIMU
MAENPGFSSRQREKVFEKRQIWNGNEGQQDTSLET